MMLVNAVNDVPLNGKEQTCPRSVICVWQAQATDVIVSTFLSRRFHNLDTT
jgi:hypothetical protein